MPIRIFNPFDDPLAFIGTKKNCLHPLTAAARW
jgi:hypothetical protein